MHGPVPDDGPAGRDPPPTRRGEATAAVGKERLCPRATVVVSVATTRRGEVVAGVSASAGDDPRARTPDTHWHGAGGMGDRRWHHGRGDAWNAQEPARRPQRAAQAAGVETGVRFSARAQRPPRTRIQAHGSSRAAVTRAERVSTYLAAQNHPLGGKDRRARRRGPPTDHEGNPWITATATRPQARPHRHPARSSRGHLVDPRSVAAGGAGDSLPGPPARAGTGRDLDKKLPRRRRHPRTGPGPHRQSRSTRKTSGEKASPAAEPVAPSTGLPRKAPAGRPPPERGAERGSATRKARPPGRPRDDGRARDELPRPFPRGGPPPPPGDGGAPAAAGRPVREAPHPGRHRAARRQPPPSVACTSNLRRAGVALTPRRHRARSRQRRRPPGTLPRSPRPSPVPWPASPELRRKETI
ncbi:translation initiation factor IF-2-like [Equus quagga]|uniref:translation initiation factor IF-2-like n=1 Tax=Equus quagga TaxID=89248 RepID=UPI001EE342F9|nr:translation initiation factor IF-2-like [Equus quagga]